MIRVPDPGRFELRLMDGSANPYLLQAGIIATGIDGIEKKRDPGQPLFINMYTDGDKYPNIKKTSFRFKRSSRTFKQKRGVINSFWRKKYYKLFKTERARIERF